MNLKILKTDKNYNTTKYLFELNDGNRIETVCIKRRTGITVCVSTQVGCAVRCAFCASGTQGLIRNLTASEIVGQVLSVKERINRIVFMGIGEPLHNYLPLIESIHILRDRNGLDFPTDGITISTVGVLNGLKKLREEHLKIQLVLSLHATNQLVRNMLIPGMRNNNIEETVKAFLSYGKRHNRKITVAYLLFPGINDCISDKKQLAKWFGNENVRINLLPFNKTIGTFRGATAEQLRIFKKDLETLGLEVGIRKTEGRNIQAACGQLVIKHKNEFDCKSKMKEKNIQSKKKCHNN
jgi:23S rRNA (adenine2503-C2)-methyltransferase